jgi:hypothetical protein
MPSRFRASLLAPLGLVAGFAVARSTGRRELGGALFGLVGLACVRDWTRTAGRQRAGLLALGYAAAMAVSHPLAKRIGAWPAVGVVSSAMAAASALSARRARPSAI